MRVELCLKETAWRLKRIITFAKYERVTERGNY